MGAECAKVEDSQSGQQCLAFKGLLRPTAAARPDPAQPTGWQPVQGASQTSLVTQRREVPQAALAQRSSALQVAPRGRGVWQIVILIVESYSQNRPGSQPVSSPLELAL